MPTDARTTATQAADEWTAPLRLKHPDLIPLLAADAANHLTEQGIPGLTVTRTGADHAYVDLQPGDGTAYRMHITVLTKEADATLGYRLLIALPDFHAALPLDLYGFHTPTYIAEKLPRLGPSGCAVLAAYTTLLSAHLDHLMNP